MSDRDKMTVRKKEIGTSGVNVWALMIEAGSSCYPRRRPGKGVAAEVRKAGKGALLKVGRLGEAKVTDDRRKGRLARAMRGVDVLRDAFLPRQSPNVPSHAPLLDA